MWGGLGVKAGVGPFCDRTDWHEWGELTPALAVSLKCVFPKRGFVWLIGCECGRDRCYGEQDEPCN